MRGKLLHVLKSSGVFPSFSRQSHRQKDHISQPTEVEFLLHELKTPLAGILGMAELIRESWPKGEPVQYVSALQESAGQLASLIDTLQPAAGPAAGEAAEDPQPVNVGEFLENIVRSHWPAARRKGLSLYLHLPHDLPARWLLNPRSLRQVVDNLLANAIKFTDQGYVLLESKCLWSRGKVAGSLEISVTDSGRGVAAKNEGAIYAVREQGENVEHHRDGGTGLGLYICKNIARHCGARLEHTPVKDGGTRFTLTLPAGHRVLQGRRKRLKPVLLQGLNCYVGLSQPARRVVIGILRAMGIGMMPSVSGTRSPVFAQCDALICDQPFIGRNPYLATGNFPQTLVDADSPGPWLISRWGCGMVKDAENPSVPAWVSLPQPVLRSNLEPLLLQLALRRRVEVLQGVSPVAGEKPDSERTRHQSGPRGGPD